MKEFYDNNRKIINKTLFIIVFFLFIYIFFNYIFGYIGPFLFGLILSMILNPLAEFITKKIKAPRWFASFFCIFILIFSILFLGSSLVSRIIKEAEAFSENYKQIFAQSTTIIEEINNRFSKLINLIPEDFQNASYDIITSLLSSITNAIGTFFKNISIGFVSKVPEIFMFIVISLISTYFFINDKEKINNVISSNSPYFIKKNMKLIKKGFLDALVGYIRAQSIIMSIIAVIVITSLTLLKYPYALFVGVAIAFIDALPVFGSGFILWPWILISFLTEDYKKAIWLLITYGIIFLSRQTLEPRILGKQIGIHPVLTLMSIYIGLKVFGVFGFILGPFTIIILKTLLSSDIVE